MDRQTLDHLALLSRLQLSEQEREDLTGQLARLLSHFQELAALATEDVEPTTHPLGVKDRFRSDEAGPSLPVEDMLAGAPDSREGFYRVPPIVES